MLAYCVDPILLACQTAFQVLDLWVEAKCLRSVPDHLFPTLVQRKPVIIIFGIRAYRTSSRSKGMLFSFKKRFFSLGENEFQYILVEFAIVLIYIDSMTQYFLMYQNFCSFTFDFSFMLNTHDRICPYPIISHLNFPSKRIKTANLLNQKTIMV